MHIIIIGGGGVGFDLARSLSTKNQDVVVIENNAKRVRHLDENLDVMVIQDNGASARVLEKAGIKTAEMLIAVTQHDEVNIIACMLAKRMGVPTTVARIKEEDYIENTAFLSKDQLGIDFIINPDKVAAQEISHIIHFPDASEVEYFAGGKVKLVSITVDERARITNQSLMEAPLPTGCIVVGIDRPGEKFIVPSGRDVVKPGDKIHILGNSRVLRNASWLLDHYRKRAYRITILGGGYIGYKVAEMLASDRTPNFFVKLVEKDPERCQELSEKLTRTMVLQGDATDLSFYKSEELEEADMVVVVTGDDRSNIVAAVLAYQLGVKKVVCEVKNPDYLPVYLKLGIDSLVNPHVLAASRIMRFTRREDVISFSILQDQNAEVIEMVLPSTAKVAGKKISQAGLPKGMIIGTLLRGEEIIIPYGETVLQPGDRLVVFTLPQVSDKLNLYFASNKKASQEQKRKQDPTDILEI